MKHPTNSSVTIIDVRTPEEYGQGCVEGSINIPLQEIEERMEEIRELQGPIVLCCASGSRSSMAVAMLEADGIECENGGPWIRVAQQLTS